MREISVRKSDNKILVDDEDYDRLANFKWFLLPSGSAYCLELQGTVAKIVTKNDSKGIKFKYKNKNRLDNRKENLELPSVVCKVDGCDGKSYVKGYCIKHYSRQANGKPLDSLGNIDSSELDKLFVKGNFKCRECRQIKPIKAFLINRLQKYGITNLCKICYRSNIEESSDKYRDFYYKKQYKISLADYNILAERQNNVCAICKNVNSYKNGKPRRLCIDHCHNSGKIRGLLCSKCNFALGALGALRDNLGFINRAASYLLTAKEHTDEWVWVNLAAPIRIKNPANMEFI